MEEVRKKLSEAKKQVKTEKVRDVEFSSLSIDLPSGEEEEEDPDAKDAAKDKAKVEGAVLVLRLVGRHPLAEDRCIAARLQQLAVGSAHIETVDAGRAVIRRA